MVTKKESSHNTNQNSQRCRTSGEILELIICGRHLFNELFITRNGNSKHMQVNSSINIGALKNVQRDIVSLNLLMYYNLWEIVCAIFCQRET